VFGHKIGNADSNYDELKVSMIVRTILLVDDEEEILMLYRLALRRKPDWNIFTALDGPMALDQAKEHRPDAIVLDVMLPGDMDGIEVCQKLHTWPSLKDVPIVIVTARSDPDTSRSAQMAGARDFWPKPISPVEFVSRLERLMNEADKLSIRH
jgi:CheY-like chemotaxis protein